MPLLKGCQPGLGWVTAVLYAASMKGLSDVRMTAKTSLAGTCHGSARAQSMPGVSPAGYGLVSPQIPPYSCKVCKRQMQDLM